MSEIDTRVRTTLPSAVRVEAGGGGLPRLAISGRHGTAQMYFQGAHLTAWQPVGAATPVLWLSRESRFEADKAIRGGVPICFPWFGAHPTDPAAPAHGFARTRDWTLIDAVEGADGTITVVMELTSTSTEPTWPHACRARYRVDVGTSLTLALEILNVDRQPLTFEEALHSYFAVQDIRQVTISGTEDTEYLDKVAAFARTRQPHEPIRFSGETDRVYLDTHATCQIHDPGLQRTIAIHKRQSDTTVIWNPWIDKAHAMPDFGDDEWTAMLCVETCNVSVYARTLQPGETHTMTAVIDVSSPHRR